ncbi:hypothetical protein V3C99_014128 [Haemonchus contortus]
MSDIAAEIKRELELGEALDREISALWAELNRYEMANTDDYTAEVIDGQVSQQHKINETRSGSLTISEKSLKSVLDQTSSIHGTADEFVRVLEAVVRDAEEKVEAFRNRVEKLQRKKESIITESAQRVNAQQEKMEGLYAKMCENEKDLTGAQKLMLLLENMKKEEEALFASTEASLHQTTLDINNKIQAKDDLHQTIAQLEYQLEKKREDLEQEKEIVRLQNEKIKKEREEIELLNKEKAELLEKIAKEESIQEELRVSNSIAEQELAVMMDQIKCADEKIAQLHADRIALEEQLASDSLKWQEKLSSVKEEGAKRVAELKKEVASQQEELQLKKCRLEVLRERFGDKAEWTEKDWEQALQEQKEEQERLSSEITSYMVTMEELKKELADDCQEKSCEEAMLALERDLLAFTERITLEKQVTQERKQKVLSDLNSARELLAQEQELYSSKRDEYEKLCAELNSIQSQIDAFTSLRTPSKPVEPVAAGAEGNKKSSRRRRAKRRQVESDSDEGSSSCIPEVEGLKPFSPDTISFKQRQKSAGSCRSTKSDSRGTIRVEGRTPGAAPENEVQMSDQNPSPAAPQQRDDEQHANNNEASGAAGSDSNSSDSSISPPYENFVTKRFPNDIFLKKTPSIDGIDSAVSPNVSAIGVSLETDSDQSIWSCASPKKGANAMDTTFETDLDQSIW